MIYGTFDSKTGIYAFNTPSRGWMHFKPRWYANCSQVRDWLKIYNKCIEGYDTAPAGAKTVLVLANIQPNLMLWDSLKQHYEGIYDQSQLHYVDYSIAAGQMPDWASVWKSTGHLLIHEFESGKIAWVRPGDFMNDVYQFFVDSAAPAQDETGEEEPDEVVYPETSTGLLLHLTCPHCGHVIF